MKYKCTNPDSPLFGKTFDVDPPADAGLVHVPVPPAVMCYPAEAFRKDFAPVNEVDDFKLQNRSLILRVIALNRTAKDTERQLKDCKAALLDLMEKAHIKKVVMDNHAISAREDANTAQFQTATFKKDYPDLYRRYTNTSYRESYLVITGRHEE